MILWCGWPASFNFATTIFLVEWLVIFFVQSSGKQLKTDFIIWLMQCSPIGDLGTPDTGGGSWYYRRIQRSRILHGVGSIFQRVLQGPFHRRLCTTFVDESFGFNFASRLPWFSGLDGLWAPCVPTKFLKLTFMRATLLLFRNLPSENFFIHSTVRLSSVGSFSLALIPEQFLFGI